MFQTIGRGWSRGVEPYVGLWDSKGPFIFLVDAAGYWLCSSGVGIWLLQTVNMAFVFAVALRLLRKVNMPPLAFAMSVGIVFMGMAWNYDYGNTVEEYVLLPLMLSVYGFCMWCRDTSAVDYRWQYAMVNGIVLALSLMSRLTNFVGIGFATLFVVVVLASRGRWRNLAVCAAAFVLGFLMFSLPFFMYFCMKGHLGEMWYAMFTYNFDYLCSAAGVAHEPLPFYVYRYAFCLLAAVCALIGGSRRGRWREIAGWLIVSVSTFFYLLSTYGYLHYGLISMPYLVVACTFLYKSGKWGMKCMLATLAVVMCVFVSRISLVFDKRDDCPPACRLLSHVPLAERSDVLLYNCSPQLYIRQDINPPCRFFALQDWASSNSRSLAEKIRRSFVQSSPRWVIVDGKAVVVNDLLQQRYVCVYSDGQHGLYRAIR